MSKGKNGAVWGADSPHLEPIEFIHRKSDGYITFHRKHGEDFELVASPKASELQYFFPQFIEDLQRDSYFSVNAFWKPFLRQAWNSQYLTCCFADLDCYRVDLTVPDVLRKILILQDDEKIPPVSIIQRSGRGVWLFWVLRDTKSNAPVRAWPEKREYWARCQNSLYDLLTPLGADRASLDVSRVTRVPGSVNTKTEKRVMYWLQAGPDGRPIFYKLRDLGDALGVPERLYSDIERAAFNAAREKPLLPGRGATGYQALQQNRLRQFLTLWSYRGQFKQGARFNALVVYAHCLRKNGATVGELKDKVVELAEQCERGTKDHPFKPRIEARNAIAYAEKIKRVRNRTISDLLSISPDECTALETWGPARQFLPEPKQRPAPPNYRSTKAEGKRRRDIIEAYVKEQGRVPPLRDIAERLDFADIVGVSTRTVSNDLKALNIPNPRARKKTASTPAFWED